MEGTVQIVAKIPKKYVPSKIPFLIGATNVEQLYHKGVKILFIAFLDQTTLLVKCHPLPVRMLPFPPILLREVNKMKLKGDNIEEKESFKWILIRIEKYGYFLVFLCLLVNTSLGKSLFMQI